MAWAKKFGLVNGFDVDHDGMGVSYVVEGQNLLGSEEFHTDTIIDYNWKKLSHNCCHFGLTNMFCLLLIFYSICWKIIKLS